MFEQMKEAGKQAIKQQLKKLWKKILPFLLKYIVLPIAVVLLIVTLIYGLYCLLTGKFTDSKNDSSEVFSLDSSTGYVADISDELIDNIKENLKASSVDMEFLGKDEAEQKDTIKTFVMAEMRSSYPKIDPFGLKNNKGGIIFEKASTGELGFMKPEEFHQKVKENDRSVLDKFTIEGDTFYYADESYVETNGERTSTTINERSGNYKTMASGYGVPYEFFVNLTVHTGQLDFALELANYVIDHSGLTITIMDTTTTTSTTTTVDYDWYYEGYKEYTFSANADAKGINGETIDEAWTEKWLEGLNRDVDNSPNTERNVLDGSIYQSVNLAGFTKEDLLKDYKKEFGEDEFYQNASTNPSIGVEAILEQMVQKTGEANAITAPARVDKEVEHAQEKNNVTNYDTSSYTRVTKVESWIGDIVIDYKSQNNDPTKTYGEDGENTNLNDSEWETVEDNDSTGNSDDYRKQKQKKYEEQYRVFNNSTDVRYDLTSTIGHIQRKKTNTVQNVYEEVTTPTYNMDPERVENQDDRVDGIIDLLDKEYGDTFTGIENKAGDLLVDSAEMWFSELEQNENTKNLANVMRYILYKYSGNDYGVTDLESLLKQLYSTMSDFSFVNIPVDFRNLTEDQEKYHITDVETLKKAFASYATSQNLVAHAQEFLDFQEKYKVNALFAAVVSIKETTAGTAGHAVDGLDNWFNIKNSDGNYIDYGSAGESIEAFYDLIANGKYYFQAGNNTINTIGHIYCPNDPPKYPTQGDDWVKFVTSQMMDMYSAIGIAVTPSGNAGQFLTIAQNCHDYVRKAGYTYSASGRNIPIIEGETPKTIDCSAYVSWVLYEFGYSDLAGHQKTTKTLEPYLSRRGWQKITNEGDLQPGDIVFVDSNGGNDNNHVQIFAGLQNGVQTWYNCGSDSAISNPTPRAWSLSSQGMKFLFAYRIPGQE